MRREGESKLVSEVSSHEANSLSAYLRVVRRRKWIIIACVIVLPVTAYILSVRQPARYEASAQVYLSSEDLAGALTGISASYVDPFSWRTPRRHWHRCQPSRGAPSPCPASRTSRQASCSEASASHRKATRAS